MEISRFLDASTIFDQSSLWGRHSEVLVIYPESCCILFCWLILANKKVEFDPWHLEFDRAKIGLLDSTLWGRVSKNNLSDFQTSFPGTWISKNESYPKKILTNHLQHIFQMVLWPFLARHAEVGEPPRCHRQLRASSPSQRRRRPRSPCGIAKTRTISRSEGKDGRNIPSRKIRTTHLLVVPMNSTFCWTWKTSDGEETQSTSDGSILPGDQPSTAAAQHHAVAVESAFGIRPRHQSHKPRTLKSNIEPNKTLKKTEFDEFGRWLSNLEPGWTVFGVAGEMSGVKKVQWEEEALC